MPVESDGSNLGLVISLEDVRAMALALPEVTESDHWGHPSFRIYGRIFVTVPDSAHLKVMIDPFDVEASCATSPKPARSCGGERGPRRSDQPGQGP